jgi:hypothetical protein
MINILWEIFTALLMVGGIFALLIGIMVLISFTLPLKAPADKSNRINRIRIFWYAISAPHRFIKSFFWLGGDETDNLKDNTWDDK